MEAADSLVEAVAEGNLDEVKRLLRERPDVLDAPGGPRAWSPIVAAIFYGYNARSTQRQSVVEFLLDAGSRVDLNTAALLADVDRVRDILRDDPDAALQTDETGASALHYAAERGAAAVARVLLEAGADPNLPSNDGETPTEMAAHPGPLKNEAAWDVVQVLREHGAAYDIMLAAAAGDEASVRRFLGEDRSLANSRREDGTTPLFVAAKNLHPGIVRMLLEHGANVNARREDGQTAMSTAVTHMWDHNGPEVVDLLLKAGAIRDT